MPTKTRVSNRKAHTLIYAREPFRGSNFTGETVEPHDHVNRGRMTDRRAIERLANDQGHIDYVVYSYATPIAWHTPDGWHVPEEKYSQSTTQHQHIMWRAISGL